MGVRTRGRPRHRTVAPADSAVGRAARAVGRGDPPLLSGRAARRRRRTGPPGHRHRPAGRVGGAGIAAVIVRRRQSQRRVRSRRRTGGDGHHGLGPEPVIRGAPGRARTRVADLRAARTTAGRARRSHRRTRHLRRRDGRSARSHPHGRLGARTIRRRPERPVARRAGPGADHRRGPRGDCAGRTRDRAGGWTGGVPAHPARPGRPGSSDRRIPTSPHRRADHPRSTPGPVRAGPGAGRRRRDSAGHRAVLPVGEQRVRRHQFLGRHPGARRHPAPARCGRVRLGGRAGGRTVDRDSGGWPSWHGLRRPRTGARHRGSPPRVRRRPPGIPRCWPRWVAWRSWAPAA